ncbi:hypothetical protein ACFLU5_04165 [Bacteroidota bacterium]
MVRNIYKKMKDYRDTGFGSKVELEHPVRMINQDGSLNVKKTGMSFLDHYSIIHQLISMS